MTNHRTQHTRREFLARSSVFTAAGLASIAIVPHAVFGAPNRPAPSDKLLFGNIGVGGRGMGFVRPDSSIALCDVDENRLAQAAERAHPNPKLYRDYRELLEQKDIDAVFITTPDHWHALQTIHACEAGKDVYVEKPACKTIEEGRAMVNAANRFARIVQVGSQGRSQEGAYYGHRYIKNGQIGRVSEVRCWHYCNPHGSWTPDSEPPQELDYDSWIGPNRMVPYNKSKTHGSFRFVFDKGGGEIRDRGAHVMSVAMWVMDSDHTGPVSIEAVGEPHFDGNFDVPATLEIKYQFKDPDWTLIWAEPGEAHEEGFTWVRGSYGANYIGDKDNLIITYGDTAETDTEKKAKEYTPPADGVEVFHSPGHRENFEDCIRTRQKPLMHIEAGHRVATLCILGNLAYILGRKLEWDPVNECVKNDDEANRLLFRPGRGEFYI
ncbi:MAG: Gfo/Idh/MocA family oxidoreductase [bacterium]|jgi:predicted dehydrogenase|nr:Gfo/Idh/MocA family oxidoreductase [bacterium]